MLQAIYRAHEFMLQATNDPAQLDTAMLQAQRGLHAAATPFWTATGSASGMGGGCENVRCLASGLCAAKWHDRCAALVCKHDASKAEQYIATLQTVSNLLSNVTDTEAAIRRLLGQVLGRQLLLPLASTLPSCRLHLLQQKTQTSEHHVCSNQPQNLQNVTILHEHNHKRLGSANKYKGARTIGEEVRCLAGGGGF